MAGKSQRCTLGEMLIRTYYTPNQDIHSGNPVASFILEEWFAFRLFKMPWDALPLIFSHFLFCHYHFIFQNLLFFGIIKLANCCFFFFSFFFVCSILAFTPLLLNLHSHLPSGTKLIAHSSPFSLAFHVSLFCIHYKYSSLKAFSAFFYH